MGNTIIVIGIIMFFLGISMIGLTFKYRIIDSSKQYKVVLLVVATVVLLMMGAYIISCGEEIKVINEKLKNPELLGEAMLQELLMLKAMYMKRSIIAIIVETLTYILSIGFIKYEDKKLIRNHTKGLWDLKKISDQLARKDKRMYKK